MVPEVFPDGQLHIHGRILEKDPDFPADGRGKLPQAASGDGDFPILQGKNGRKDFKKGGFAAPVGPQHAKHAAFFQSQADVVEDALLSVGVADPFCLHCR